MDVFNLLADMTLEPSPPPFWAAESSEMLPVKRDEWKLIIGFLQTKKNRRFLLKQQHSAMMVSFLGQVTTYRKFGKERLRKQKYQDILSPAELKPWVE